jgi:hypothetical protein
MQQYNLTEAEYHAHPAMSQTKMKLLLENPRVFYMTYITKELEKEKGTIAKNFGTALDLAITEPDKYAKLLVKNCKNTEIPGYITVEWKRKIDKWVKDLQDYFVDALGVTFGDIVNAQEVTMQDMIFYNYKGIEWRMKTDILSVTHRFFIDIKKTKCKTKRDFINDFFKYGYHIQAASYVNGIKIKYGLDYFDAYYFGICDTTGEVFGLHVSNRLLAFGMMEIDRGCDLYNHNLQTNEWSKNEGITELNAPQWVENLIINRSTVQ